MKTTLNKIYAHRSANTWAELRRHILSKPGNTEDTEFSIATVVDSNNLNDALWCLRAVDGYDKEKRLFAVWCARRVQHLMKDPRSIAALDVAERFAHGQATEEDLKAAAAAAEAAAAEAAAAAAWSAAAAAASWSDWRNERTAQEAELRRICEELK